MSALCRLTGYSTRRQAVNTYEQSEVAIGIEGAAGSPFRSAALAVDAEVRTPSGDVMHVPTFYAGPADGAGQPWRLRFAGRQAGDYALTLVLRVGGNEASRIEGPSFSLARAGRGYIRRAKNTRYLEFEDGTAYLPVGQNVCFTTAKARLIPTFPEHDGYVSMRSPDLPWDQAYARWFGRMGDNGANWARLWLGAPDFDLMDGQPWEFNLEHADRLDHIFDLADRHGIHLCLCLDYFRKLFFEPVAIHTSNWFSARDRAWGRLLLASGGKEHADLFTTPAIEELLGDLIRYCVARWGWSPRLFAWELWNEIETVANPAVPAQVDWVRRATACIRRLDPWGHLVKSSAHLARSRAFWGPDFGDLNDIHMYFGWMGTETAKDLGRLIQEYTTEIRQEEFPFIVGEVGLAREVNTAEYGLVADLADRDRQGVALHESLWAGLFVGGCGTGMVWWWDEHTDLNDQYGRFRGIARFVRDVPWSTVPFVPAVCRTSNLDLRAWELRSSGLRLVWIQSLHFTWWNVVQGARLSPIRNAQLFLDDVAPGTYELQWCSTETGEPFATECVTAGENGLAVKLPEVRQDVALKIRRRE